VDFFLVVQKAAQGVEPRVPELFIAGQPHGSLLQRFGRQFAANDPAFRDAAFAFAESQQHIAPGAIGQRGEDAVEIGV
jgi:hypothetical protein